MSTETLWSNDVTNYEEVFKNTITILLRFRLELRGVFQMKRLSMVVTAIHRKREEEEKLKSKQSYHQLFPESRLSEKENQSFSYYRLRRNSFDDDHEGWHIGNNGALSICENICC